MDISHLHFSKDTKCNTKAEQHKEREGEPIYETPLTPDYIKLDGNSAYLASGTFTLQSEANVYSLVEDNSPPKINQVDLTTNERNESDDKVKQPCSQYVCLVVVIFFAMLLIVIAASITITLVLLLPRLSATHQCDCVQTDNKNITDNFAWIKQNVTKITMDIEQNQNEIKSLHAKLDTVMWNTSNTQTLLPTPASPTLPPPPIDYNHPLENITPLHNCTTRIEVSCTIGVGGIRCQTLSVPEERDGAVSVSFQCIRMTSIEQNPMVGVLDITNSHVTCLCYVLVIGESARTDTVRCGLRVTRCSK